EYRIHTHQRNGEPAFGRGDQARPRKRGEDVPVADMGNTTNCLATILRKAGSGSRCRSTAVLLRRYAPPGGGPIPRLRRVLPHKWGRADLPHGGEVNHLPHPAALPPTSPHGGEVNSSSVLLSQV